MYPEEWASILGATELVLDGLGILARSFLEFLGGGAALALLAYLAKLLLERFAAKELEWFKARISRTTSQLSRLDERRVEVASRLYGMVLDLEEAVEAMRDAPEIRALYRDLQKEHRRTRFFLTDEADQSVVEVIGAAHGFVSSSQGAASAARRDDLTGYAEFVDRLLDQLQSTDWTRPKEQLERQVRTILAPADDMPR